MSPDLSVQVGGSSFDRRHLLKWAGAVAAASNTAASPALAQPVTDAPPGAQSQARPATGQLQKRMIGFMLAHEQFPVPELIDIGKAAADGGFHLLATSDHLQPWQANEGHCGEA